MAKERNVAVATMLKESGAGERLVNNLERGSMPSADRLALVAEYFGVPTDYFLGREATFANNGVTTVAFQGYNYGNAAVNGDSAKDKNENSTIQEMSEEQRELNEVYAILKPRRRVKLMAFAFDLEEEQKAERSGK
jgi:transcriptional regulator with XRE-family HTH domain